MDEEKEDDILPGLEDLEETTLPGLDDKLPESEEIEENDNILPGLEESNEKEVHCQNQTKNSKIYYQDLRILVKCQTKMIQCLSLKV